MPSPTERRPKRRRRSLPNGAPAPGAIRRPREAAKLSGYRMTPTARALLSWVWRPSLGRHMPNSGARLSSVASHLWYYDAFDRSVILTNMAPPLWASFNGVILWNSYNGGLFCAEVCQKGYFCRFCQNTRAAWHVRTSRWPVRTSGVSESTARALTCMHGLYTTTYVRASRVSFFLSLTYYYSTLRGKFVRTWFRQVRAWQKKKGDQARTHPRAGNLLHARTYVPAGG
jgi:hypothetical protein